MNVTKELQTEITHANYSAQTYAPYSRYATMTALEAAAERMGKTFEESSCLFIQTDSEGYLCLCYEKTVRVDPPQTDEHGEVMHGCDIDHRHFFESERVCKVPG